MEFPDLSEVSERVRAIAKEVVRAEAVQVDQEARWPVASIRALQDAGLGGLTVPKRFGGLGGGLQSMVEAAEILGSECASVAMCYGMHCVGSAVIAAKATDEQVDRFLKPVIHGRHFTTLALSEPGTGAHFYIPEMKLTSASDSEFELNGEKSFITNGSYADSYVVSAVETGTSTGIGRFSMLVVPGDADGIEWQSSWNGFGMRGNSSCNAGFKNVRVAKSNLLGQEGDQIWYVFEVVAPYFLMAMAGTYLGVAQAALTDAIQYMKSRVHTHSYGQLGSVSILQHRLGLLWSELESARQLVYHGARLADSGDPNALAHVLSAKAQVGDCVTRVTNEVMTIVGGRGYSENGAASRRLRDARAAHIMSPSTDLLRVWTGRALLGLPLLSEV